MESEKNNHEVGLYRFLYCGEKQNGRQGGGAKGLIVAGLAGSQLLAAIGANLFVAIRVTRARTKQSRERSVFCGATRPLP